MDKMRDFKLEVYFGKYEFSAPYLLTQSDCQSMEVKELLSYEPGAEEAFLNCYMGYTEVPGNPELRELVASLYKNIGSDDILMHTGAQEAVFDFMSVALNKGDHIISMFPTYQSLYEFGISDGFELSKWELKNEGTKWTLDFNELEAMIKPNTKVIAVNTPNNPTGYTLSEEEIKTLCKIAEKHGLYIFADEVYKGLELDGIKRPWVCDLYDKAISLGVMSKAYGLAGLRIGWVATRDKEIIDKMTRFKHYLSICNSVTSEFLSIVALKHGQKILDRNMGIIKQNLETANRFFEKYKNLFVNNVPMCGPIAFHKMNIEKPMDIFCEELVQKAGVLLLPSQIYDYDGQYFRMGYGRKGFDESLNKFEEYIVNNVL